MEDELRHHLLICVGAFVAHDKKISAATIGKRSLNDNTFFSRIADGQGFTVRTYDRVMGWLSAEWPADLAWPTGVVRPEPVVVAA